MQIDQKTLKLLLAMNDEQLSALLEKIAKESGITPEAFGAQSSDLQKIRQALGSATEEDIQKMNAIYAAYRQKRRQ